MSRRKGQARKIELEQPSPPELVRLKPEADRGEAIQGVMLIRRGSATQAIRVALPPVLVEQYAVEYSQQDLPQVTAGWVDRAFDAIRGALMSRRRAL